MRENTSTAALLLALCAAAFGAEPDAAQHAPADAAVFITVRDVRLPVPIAELTAGLVNEKTPEGARLFLPKLAAMTAGRASYALFMPEGKRPPSFLFRVPIDEAKGNVHDLLTQTVAQIVGAENAKPAADGAIRELRNKDGEAFLFWAVHKGVLYVSMDRGRVASAPDPLPPDRTLAADAAHKALAAHVDWTADLTAFADLQRSAWQAMDPEEEIGFVGRMAWLHRWLAPNVFAAVGFSWKSDGKTVSGRLAALTPGKRRGIASLLDVPNAPPAHLDRIPEDAVLYSTIPSTAGAVGRVARFLSELDRDVGGEFETELGEFNKELDVDIGKDLFDNLGPIASGLRWSDRGPEMLYLAAARDPDRLVRCANALADYNQTPLRKLDRNGRAYHILPTKPPMGWTFDGGLLVFSNTFEAAEEAIALGKAKEGGKSLASQPALQKLRARLPGTAAMFWALDAHRAAKAAQGMIGLTSLVGAVPDGAKQVVGNLVAQFAEAEPGLSIGVALCNKPDAFVLHVESLAGDPLITVAELARLAAVPPRRAPVQAWKMKSSSNLREIILSSMVWLTKKGDSKLYPTSLKALLDDGVLQTPQALLCPGSGSKLVDGEFVSDYDSAFDRAGFQIEEKDAGLNLMAVWEKKPFFPEGRNAAFFDSHVEWLSEEQFRKKLAELDEWIAKHKPKE